MPFIKLITAILGFSFYGFFGGLVGWVLGSVLSTMLTDGPRALLPSGRQALHQERQDIFLETLFLLMGKLAKADAHVSKAEIDHVERFMRQLGMTGAHRKAAITYFQKGVQDDFQIQTTLEHFLQVCGSSLQMKHLLLVYLVGVALADGELHASENDLLLNIATKFGYSQRGFDQLMAMIQGQNRFRDSGGQGYQQDAHRTRRATNTLEDAYQALGVSANDSDKEIKRAYRKLISQYHPDKLIGQGVPEDMINKATERTKEIHAAYDLIEQYRKGE